MTSATASEPVEIPHDLPGMGVQAGAYLVRRPGDLDHPAAVVTLLAPDELARLTAALCGGPEAHQTMRPRLEVVK